MNQHLSYPHAEGLMQFLDQSPVNFFAIANVEEMLAAAGWQKVDASQPFPKLESGSKFYITKNDSALFAFQLGNDPLAKTGVKVICAHSDSPTMRIKPHAAMCTDGGLVKLNTEVYGGPILSTWFDRPLSLAGRVMLRSSNPLHPTCQLLNIRRPLMVIPNLAIHFNRSVNDGVSLSRQKDMLPVLGYVAEHLATPDLIYNLIADELQVKISEIIDFDLYLYDTTPACSWGINQEFISSGRLDDLSMVHAGLSALLNSSVMPHTQVLAIFDNEETGSGTKQGAGSPFLRSILERICLMQGDDKDAIYQAIEHSFMVSADNAHAYHPNYPEKYDPTNHPLMGRGPVVKYNASQKYASDADSGAVFAEICRLADVPCQRFVNHSDVAGGSTLGNILTSSIPMRGVDMGSPLWAMHSVRESASLQDHEWCIQAFSAFYNSLG